MFGFLVKKYLDQKRLINRKVGFVLKTKISDLEGDILLENYA